MKKQNFKSKKQSMKGDSGITLIALIITIIVLLILAVVAIGAVNNTGIIQYAQNSADEYTDGRDKENTILQNYMDVLNHYNLNKEPSNPLKEIAGLYYSISMNMQLTEDGKVIMIAGEQKMEMGNYAYDENAKTVTVAGMQLNFINDGTNKILRRYEGSDKTMYLFTTGGLESLSKPENGTYGGTYTENETAYQIKVVINNAAITYYRDETIERKDEDSIINNGIIYCLDDENHFDSLFKISPDGNTLTGYGKWDGAILTKE